MESEGSLSQSQEPTTCLYSEPDQSSSCPIPFPWISTLILSSHLCMGLSSGFFPSTMPTKPLHGPLPHMCSVHLFLLDSITRIIFGENYRSLSPLLCSFLGSPVPSSLILPNTLLSTLFSDTHSLRSPPQCERPSVPATFNERNTS